MATTTIVLRNVRLHPDGPVQDVSLCEGRLEEWRPSHRGQEVEGNGALLLPGMIDPHVHLRSPGLEAAEDWDSGTRAAARGGVTTLFDMPNTSPPTTTRALLEAKRSLAKMSRVDWGLHLGATSENLAEIATCGNIASVKVYMGSSTGALLVTEEETLEAVMGAAAKAEVPVSLHAEDEGIVRERAEALRGDEDATVHGWVRPPEAAATAVSRALAIGARTGATLVFCHVSTQAELDLLRKAKREGRPVAVEATPHHLFLAEEDVARLGNYAKVNPPLRSRRDREALWEALADGTLDWIATDHAPHVRAAKERPYAEAPSGVPGLETALPLLLTAMREGRLSFDRLLDLTSRNASRFFRVENRGWVLADLDTERGVETSDIQSRCGWSPFVGWRLRGWPRKVWVASLLVFDDGWFGPLGTGREVRFRAQPVR